MATQSIHLCCTTRLGFQLLPNDSKRDSLYICKGGAPNSAPLAEVRTDDCVQNQQLLKLLNAKHAACATIHVHSPASTFSSRSSSETSSLSVGSDGAIVIAPLSPGPGHNAICACIRWGAYTPQQRLFRLKRTQDTQTSITMSRATCRCCVSPEPARIAARMPTFLLCKDTPHAHTRCWL